MRTERKWSQKWQTNASDSASLSFVVFFVVWRSSETQSYSYTIATLNMQHMYPNSGWKKVEPEIKKFCSVEGIIWVQSG